MKNTELLNKIKGSLYGFAIGDAMGATTEFLNLEEVKSLYGKVDNIIGGGWLHLRPGEVTDDTEMTLCVAYAYRDAYSTDKEEDAKLGGFLFNCTENFRTWLHSGPKDVGNSCNSAISRNWLELDPYKWMDNNYQRQLETKREDLGNGALMRCLFPLLCGNLGPAVMQAKLTHNNHLNDWALVTYGLEVIRILNGGEIRPLIKHEASPTGHVENTLENAFYWAGSTDNFRDSILGPVNRGGDADTIAAITGGLTGAYYGYDAIPEKWVDTLDSKVKEELNQLADWAVEHQQ